MMRFIGNLFPKDHHKIMFDSRPSFSDNSRALFEYIYSKNFGNRNKFIWVVDEGFETPKEYSNTIFITRPRLFKKGYLTYLKHLYTSYYLFATHTSFVEANPKRQMTICLWHGTMLKKICFLNEREMNLPRKDQYRYFVSPSVIYQPFFMKCFDVTSEHILISGYPRSDLMFQPNNFLQMLNIEKGNNKLVLFMPTFRVPQGSGYKDAEEKSGLRLMDISNETKLIEINEKVKALNLIMVIKLHPYDNIQPELRQYSNLIVLPHKIIQEFNLQLYHLLYHADALITDYSSVFCDYLLLDRPIAFNVDDIDDYENNRGFVFDNPLDYMPGYIVKNESDLDMFLNNISEGIDISKETRHKLFNVYNDYKDGNNSKRLLNQIGFEF